MINRKQSSFISPGHGHGSKAPPTSPGVKLTCNSADSKSSNCSVSPASGSRRSAQKQLSFSAKSYNNCAKTSFSTSSSAHNHLKVAPVDDAAMDPLQASPPNAVNRKRCAWITPQSDAAYVAYHDEEWGVPVHDDRRLFELLVLAGIQTEVPWSSLLIRREAYREAFSEFDPSALATYNASKVASFQSHNDIILTHARIQSIVDNAKLVMKIVKEFGTFDKYLWKFVSYKPIVNNYKFPNCIPVKTSKSELISKDLQKRGFRHVSPIVIYSFMQASGMANDHLLQCFRYHECNAFVHPLPTMKQECDLSTINNTCTPLFSVIVNQC